MPGNSLHHNAQTDTNKTMPGYYRYVTQNAVGQGRIIDDTNANDYQPLLPTNNHNPQVTTNTFDPSSRLRRGYLDSSALPNDEQRNYQYPHSVTESTCDPCSNPRHPERHPRATSRHQQ